LLAIVRRHRLLLLLLLLMVRRPSLLMRELLLRARLGLSRLRRPARRARRGRGLLRLLLRRYSRRRRCCCRCRCRPLLPCIVLRPRLLRRLLRIAHRTVKRATRKFLLSLPALSTDGGAPSVDHQPAIGPLCLRVVDVTQCSTVRRRWPLPMCGW